jgi:hypothetical protein
LSAAGRSCDDGEAGWRSKKSLKDDGGSKWGSNHPNCYTKIDPINLVDKMSLVLFYGVNGGVEMLKSLLVKGLSCLFT